jgi:hypothetical protein
MEKHYYCVRANRVSDGIVFEVEGIVRAASPKEAAKLFCWGWTGLWCPTEIAVFFHGDVWCFDTEGGILHEIED